jgi:hypothetical protein
MNSFVNPKKRGVSLRSGCKDLIDVLHWILVSPKQVAQGKEPAQKKGPALGLTGDFRSPLLTLRN